MGLEFSSYSFFNAQTQVGLQFSNLHIKLCKNKKKCILARPKTHPLGVGGEVMLVY